MINVQIDKLFSRLNAENVSYVHWKSNSRLGNAIAGNEDLDVYAHYEFKSKVLSILQDLGFIRALSRTDKWQSEIFHYLFLDSSSQKWIHLHIHFELWLGWDYNKCYQLPFAERTLNHPRIMESIKVIRPEYELVLLVIRIYLKSSFITFFYSSLAQKYRLLRSGYNLSSKEQSEFTWLKQQVNIEEINSSCIELGLVLPNRFFLNAIKRLPARRLLENWILSLRLQKALLKSGPLFQIYVQGFVRIFSDRLRSYLSIFKISWPRIPKKRFEKGMVICFVGSDGSGKSTNVAFLGDVLSKQIWTQIYHYGKPKEFHVVVKVLKTLSFVLNVLELKRSSYISNSLSVAVSRQILRKRILNDVKKGCTVILDRLTLDGVESMDNRRLKVEVHGKIWSGLEAYLYGRNKIEPNILFVLNVSLETAKARRPNDDIEFLEKRVGAIKSKIPYLSCFKGSVIIDADGELDSIQENILDLFWRNTVSYDY